VVCLVELAAPHVFLDFCLGLYIDVNEKMILATLVFKKKKLIKALKAWPA